MNYSAKINKVTVVLYIFHTEGGLTASIVYESQSIKVQIWTVVMEVADLVAQRKSRLNS